MLTVLWVSVVGGSLLFFALAALVGLMYLLTAPWLFPTDGKSRPRIRRLKRRRFRRRAPEAEPTSAMASETEANDAEQERRRRAAALAVATAIAEEAQLITLAADAPADWRLMHRARRLARNSVRQRDRL